MSNGSDYGSKSQHDVIGFVPNSSDCDFAVAETEESKTCRFQVISECRYREFKMQSAGRSFAFDVA